MENWESPYSELVGVIGGIGPEASALLYQYVNDGQSCSSDNGHIPLLIYNNPQIPNNNKSLLGKGPSSVPALVYSAKTLKNAGATRVCMACNTAHAYASQVEKLSGVPMINMLDLTAVYVLEKLKKSSPSEEFVVGLMGTLGTIQGGLYHKAIEIAGGGKAVVITPSKDGMHSVQNCIDRIKGGEKTSNEVIDILSNQAMELVNNGAQVIITGCTELPLSLNSSTVHDFPVELVDPMKVLADYIVDITLKSKKYESILC